MKRPKSKFVSSMDDYINYLEQQNKKSLEKNQQLRKALRETSNNLNAFYSQMGIENDPIEHIIEKNKQLLKNNTE